MLVDTMVATGLNFSGFLLVFGALLPLSSENCSKKLLVK
jgi:hypothetical protein